MDVLEFEGKRLLAEQGVPVPEGLVVRTPQEAVRVTAKLGGGVMVKAQMRQGGRGKAGLVQPAADAAEAGRIASALLGTFREVGEPQVEAVLIERRVAVSDELYFAIRVDDVLGAPVALASLAGGVDVEAAGATVAQRRIDVLRGLRRHDAVELWKQAGLTGRVLRGAAEFSVAVWRAYRAADADLVEINPVIVDDAGRFWAADAKVTVSDDALFRQPLLGETWLSEPGTPFERRARALGINSYLDLDGDVLLFCSGAGFSMCVFDAVTRAGMQPANFLDMGGASDRVTRKNTAELMFAKAERSPNVKGILIAMVLSMQPLENSVDIFAEVFSEHPDSVPAVAWLHAGLASTANLSVEDARARLEAAGIRTSDTIEGAIAILGEEVESA